MNKSIISVGELTLNDKVAQFVDTLITNRGRLFHCVFTKKDGTSRSMTFSPSVEWHKIMGYDTTEVGRKIVNTKAHRNMIVVTEHFLGNSGENCIRPRTINLETVTSLKVM